MPVHPSGTGQFLLTHPMWDVTVFSAVSQHLDLISTHTSHVGCDGAIRGTIKGITFLLTHPMWDVTHGSRYPNFFGTFLLTHPMWDVTKSREEMQRNEKFLLTHPMWDVTAVLTGTARQI